MNADIDVSFFQDGDSEKADITIRSFGCVSELRFDNKNLDAVAHLTSGDMGRLLEALAEAERRRVDPDENTIAAIDLLKDRFDYLDEDQTRLYLQIEFVMPIAACGSVKLEPNLKTQTLKEFMDDDDESAQPEN
jgi:hypothetical protein